MATRVTNPESSEEQHRTGRAPSGDADNSSGHDGASQSKGHAAGDEGAGLHDTGDKKKSKLATWWEGLGLDLPTVLTMMKGGVAPAIALAFYRSNNVAQTYSTLGYLVAIITLLSMPIMPRAKFIQTMTFNVLSACLGAAIAMLATWSAVQARLHTTPPGSKELYNSSQSAVCGVWLFFNIWLINTIKAKFPQFTLPVVLYAIQINVALSYGTRFPTVAYAESFVRRLLISILTGLGLGTAVHFLILNVSCRKVVFKEITGYVGLLKKALGAHKALFSSLETTDMFAAAGPGTKNKDEHPKRSDKSPAAQGVQDVTKAFLGLFAKLHGDLPFAKREIAFGKLTGDDLETIQKMLRNVMIPMVGLSSLMDIFSRIAEFHHWRGDEDDISDPKNVELRKEAVKTWNEVMQKSHGPFAEVLDACDGGLSHFLLKLGLTKPPKKKGADVDVEANGDSVKPGDKAYAAHLRHQMETFSQGRKTRIKEWIEQKGIHVSEEFLDHPSADDMEEIRKMPDEIRARNQRQMYMYLFMIYLLDAIGHAILDLVEWADQKDVANAKSKFLFPGKKRLWKWIKSVFSSQEDEEGNETTAAGLERDNTTVYLGEAYKNRKDPEHLPPANALEKFGNILRVITTSLRSTEISFGFRAACATMTIAIVCFLRDTQEFFLKQRLLWAMIMVAISMTPTTGQGMFQFSLRIIGTFFAMLIAWLAWYIPDHHVAGVIVFIWLFVSILMYIPLKRPDVIIVGLLSMVTLILIVGYELEVDKLGRKLAESNGQPAYPIYTLGPYRLASVIGGIAVAFIWTYFPYPVTEHSALRQKLGASLYLAANYYSIIHETVLARIRGHEGELSDPKTPGYALTKARNKVFAKQMLVLQGLQSHQQFVRWEVPFGGKFPIEQYEEIIQLVRNITNYTTLITYASSTFTNPSLHSTPAPADPTPDSLSHAQSTTQWLLDFRRLVSQAGITSNEVTSMLSLLSSSITSGQPLPPYLSVPSNYNLYGQMWKIDRDVLGLRHVTEPGYAAFAVLQISTACVSMDLTKLLTAVKGLVGELDFSFHVVSTENGSGETLVGGREKTE